MFGHKWPAAAVACPAGQAFVKLKFHSGTAVAAQAVPRFHGIDKTHAANGTSEREKVFPQKKSPTPNSRRHKGKTVSHHTLIYGEKSQNA